MYKSFLYKKLKIYNQISIKYFKLFIFLNISLFPCTGVFAINNDFKCCKDNKELIFPSIFTLVSDKFSNLVNEDKLQILPYIFEKI